MGVKEKAMPLVFSAIQAVSEAKRVVEAKIQSIMQETLRRYESELEDVKARLAKIETALESRVETPAPKKAGRLRRAPKAAKEGAPSCAIDGCANKHMARGLCKNHYYQFKRGTIVKTPDGYAYAKDVKPARQEAAPQA